MKEGLIERIKKTGSFEDDLFFEIIETEDILERTQFIEAVRRKCQRGELAHRSCADELFRLEVCENGHGIQGE